MHEEDGSMLFLTKHEINVSFLVNHHKFMSGCLYYYNDLKDKRPHIGFHDKLQNNFTINGNSFQRKPELLAVPYILQ